MSGFGKKQRRGFFAGVRDSPAESEESTDTETEQKKTILMFFVKLIAVCAVLWAIFTFIFGLYQMNGESMYPRLRDGDLVLYYRLDKDYCIGDVVTYRVNGYRKTARIVAMGGDVVDINEENQLLVNGNVQEEEIFYPTEPLTDGCTFPYTVEEDSYFMLGDFRTVSVDSRRYGTIAKKDIDGKVITIMRRRGI